MANIRRVFLGGNTAEGFYSLHDNIIDINRNMLYIIKGMPGGGKSSMMKQIGKIATDNRYSVEYQHCPSDPNSIDGIVIDKLRIAIVDGTLPHAIEPVYPGLIDHIIDLGQYIEMDKLQLYKDEIMLAKGNNKSSYRRAFNFFKASKSIYEEIENTNKSNVDFERINKLTLNYVDRIFNEGVIVDDFIGFKERHLFSEAYTPEGYIDYTPSLLDGKKYRYYLEGNIGTGKTTFLNRIIEEAKMRNYHIEVYHNPLIPSKLDSVIIIELDTIISTSIETKKYIHAVIDFDEFFDDENLNQEDFRLFSSLVDRGIYALEGATKNHLVLENIYKKCINYEGINQVRDRLINEIFE